MPRDERVDADPDGRSETVTERADRNFNELLQELRVAQTGIQILFAFQLSLPFTQRFHELDRAQRAVYLVALVAAASATACLIAPVSQHRVLFRHKRKPELVSVANRLAIAGLACLLVAVVGSVYLIIDFVVGAPLAGIVVALLLACLLYLWYVFPLIERHRHS